MAIQYNGKSPNKLWYGYQNTKAFFKAFGDYTTKREAVSGMKNSGISLGTLAVAQMIVIPMIAAVPLLPLVVSLASSVAAIHYAFKAFRDFKDVAQSRFVSNEVSAAEDRWAERKARPGLFKRLGNALSKKKEPKAAKAPDTRPRTEGPISKGVVFDTGGKSFDFNDNADKKAPPANNNKPPVPPQKKNGTGPKP